MTTAKEIPLLLTPDSLDSRSAMKAGIKTETRWAMKPQPDYRTGNMAFSAEYVGWTPVSKLGDIGILDPKLHKSPYSCPQKSPVRYWVKEPVEVFQFWDYQESESQHGGALVIYPDDLSRSLVQLSPDDVEKLRRRKDYRRPTTSMHMLKAFTRTWLRGKSVHPERLGDITAEGAIAEGIEVDPEMSGVEDYKGDLFERQLILDRRKVLAYSPVWRDYLNGGYDLDPVQSYVSLWQSIHGPDPWDPQRWVWVVRFELEG